jgi:rhodanese-related sulfurtransferase
MKLNVTLTGKTIAALIVASLAIVAALAASIAHGTSAGPTDFNAVVQTIADEKDHVTPGELARWIIEKQPDYQLIDIRQPWQFDDYHIPTAINIPFREFFQENNLKRLDRGKKTIVYGLGAGHAAETQLLLSMKGYDAYSLREGISAWWELVLTPVSLRSESASPEGYQQARQIREYFMGSGTPRPAGTESAAPVSPAAPAVAPERNPQQKEKKLTLGKGCS